MIRIFSQMEVIDTVLFKYLKQKNEEFSGKVSEVEKEITKWLSYIPNTFPHYTSHTIEHSKEIILQMSNLLFRDEEDPDSCIIKLSGVEVYI